MASKRVSIYYAVSIAKNETQGGAWLSYVTKKNRDGELLQDWHSAWRSLPAAKKAAALITDKRPKWTINEEKTLVTGFAEVRVLAE